MLNLLKLLQDLLVNKMPDVNSDVAFPDAASDPACEKELSAYFQKQPGYEPS